MKKKLLLLLVIYLAFISLGLPDSILGAGWPAMFTDLKVSADYAGFISMIVAAGTVVSSLFSAQIIRQFGVAAVTTISVLMTALALLGFSYSSQFIFLCLLAVPLGLGAGAVDAGLNNYVALHYKARHMNWLHCFWGIGAAIGPMIMSGYLASGYSWRNGYHTVGWIQIALVVILFLSLPLWIKNNAANRETPLKTKVPFKQILAVKGLKQMLLVFFCYCTIEATFGLWGASYLVFSRNFEPDNAAKMASLYYLGITAGRFLSGIVVTQLSNRQMVIIGEGIILLGIITLLLPFGYTVMPGFILIGLGCAPIFPSLLHETPRNFGEKYSQTIMGMQMASAYTGITLMPFLFGILASYLNYSYLMMFLGIALALMIYLTFDVNRKIELSITLKK